MKWRVEIVDYGGQKLTEIVEAVDPAEAIAEALRRLGMLKPEMIASGYVELYED